MPRLGLCCTFAEQPIKFRTTTATHLATLPRAAALGKVAGIGRDNAAALEAAVRWCAANGVGGFRMNNAVLPMRTHPKAGYLPALLPGGRGLIAAFRAAGELAGELGVRLLFHPDQFVVLGSPRDEVVESSVEELEHLAEVADWVGADTLILHGGGAYGDKPAALGRFAETFGRLSEGVRGRLAVENDDRVFTPADLLPLCRELRVPLVYDVHHHRCLPDGMSVGAATDAAVATWEQAAAPREPLLHISSPKEGWDGPKPHRHADYIDPADWPACWDGLTATVEVEAKAKELAVLKLAASGSSAPHGRG